MCPEYSEVRQAETSHFGGEKGLCRAKQREQEAHAQNSKHLDDFGGKGFICNIWGKGCRV